MFPWKRVFIPRRKSEICFSKKEQEVDSFSIMIGYDGSQSLQIKQAQSAILYPPKGLHTLITGGKRHWKNIIRAYDV